MAVSLKHAFNSAKSDGGDSSLVRPSNWNAEHTLTLSGPNKALGRLATGSGSAEEVTIRETLTGNRTYYVRTDGNDSNTGLVDSSGGAKLTVQGAMNAVAQIDFNGFKVTVQVRDGTYSGNIIIPVTVGQATVYDFEIVGNTTTPSNVILTSSSGRTIDASSGPRVFVKAVKLGGETQIYAWNGGAVIVGEGTDFGAGTYHVMAQNGGVVGLYWDYTISGGATAHFLASAGGMVSCYGGEVTLTGAPAFATAFAVTETSSIEIGFNTFTGSATGSRYNASLNGVINTYGGGSTYLPGNVAGSTATGGQYA
jgi:hypothetical protein